ncbi:type II toxin-antitoxin system toxin DNA ADP-ribosyl transferase DarT [Bradyrhizobium sp. USDA 4451]
MFASLGEEVLALPELTAENALIFRITHKNNLPWILDNGLHCRNSNTQDPQFVNIGLVELIDKRKKWPVPVGPRGTLSDYVPFYFTPRSMMAYNIHTGRSVNQRDNDQLVILVSSLNTLEENGVPFVITDRHACATLTKYSNSLDHLKKIDWKILRNSDFSRDNDDPDKSNRYMAEALVHKHMPINALHCVACCDEKQNAWATDLIKKRKLELQVHTKRGWYF